MITAPSTKFTDAINSSVSTNRTRVMVDWSDSRHLEKTVGSEIQTVSVTTNDAHASAAKGSVGAYFGPSQAANGWDRQASLWGVAGALDVNGQVIRADGNWSAMPNEEDSKYEFGWWSGTVSSSVDGTFTTDPYVDLDFGAARVSHIKVNTSEYYGQVSSIKVEYKKFGESSWITHAASASIPSGSYSYESAIDNGNYLNLIGVRVTALATRNKGDYARFNEVSPIYREDMSSYIINVNTSKVHTLHNSSLPIGATASNTASLSLDNTSGKFSPFSTSGYGPYMRKDVKLTVEYGVLVDDANNIYEYVPAGTFWVDNWNVSSGMVVTAQCRDYTKFLSELQIDDGFLLSDTLAGRAVSDLALRTNFPRADIDYLKKFHQEAIDKGGLVHLQFKDGNPFDESSNTNVAEVGVWANWWNKSQDRWTPTEDISLEYNALRDTIRTINTAAAPTTREVVSSNQDALNLNGLNNGVSDVFTSAQTSGGSPYYLNARFYTFFIAPTSGDFMFRLTTQNAGVRMYMNDTLIMDRWGNVDVPYNVNEYITADVGALRSGAAYRIKIDYFHWYGTQKLFWEYSTNGGSSWSDVASSSCYLAVAQDAIGRRDTYSSSYGLDHYNHGVYQDDISPASLSQTSGMTSDSESKSTLFDSTSNDHNQHVTIPYDESYNAALSTADIYTGEYSVEVLAQFDAAIGGKGVYAGNIDDAHSATKGIGLFYTSSANGVYLRDGSQTLTATNSDNTTFGTSLWTHIVATYDGTTLKYYVNGVLKASATGSGHASWASQNFLVAKSTDSSSGSSVSYYFDGKFDELVMYNNALSSAEVLENYYVINMKEIPVYDYLWGNSTDVFNLMQEISTADLGMFYFDENNKFNYHHYNRFYESFIDQHALVQQTISDDSFIVSGSTPIDLQANKVTVRVTNPTLKAATRQGIWRAPSPTTLVIAGLTGNMTNSQTSMSVTTTEGDYPWYRSGYVKVDDEIIQYTSRTTYTFEGLTRGMFGTAAAAHTAVVDSVTTKVRETKYFTVKYAQAPSVDVYYPFIVAIDFEEPALVNVDVWEPTPFGAELVLSASTSNTIGDLVYVEGKNEMLGLQYFASISGVPINVQSNAEQIVEQSASNHPSIKKYGIKSIEIANKFITSATWASTIAEFIRNKFQDVVMVLQIRAAGLPQLQLGDRIKIGTFDNLSISNKEYWVIQIDTAFDGGISQTLTLREAA
jgi:hypothetical protein